VNIIFTKRNEKKNEISVRAGIYLIMEEIHKETNQTTYRTEQKESRR